MLVPLKLTPSAPSQVLVDRNLCWSQLPTGHLWYFRVGVPHRGGWLKEQAFIRSKSNIFPLHRSLSTVHVRINQKNWTSDLDFTDVSGCCIWRFFAQDVTRLCETRPLGERLRLQKGNQALQEAQRRWNAALEEVAERVTWYGGMALNLGQSTIPNKRQKVSLNDFSRMPIGSQPKSQRARSESLGCLDLEWISVPFSRSPPRSDSKNRRS